MNSNSGRPKINICLTEYRIAEKIRKLPETIFNQYEKYEYNSQIKKILLDHKINVHKYLKK